MLTALTVVLMSAALVTGVYGMNFRYMPELEWRFGYPFTLGVMLTLALVLAAIFRSIRWL